MKYRILTKTIKHTNIEVLSWYKKKAIGEDGKPVLQIWECSTVEEALTTYKELLQTCSMDKLTLVQVLDVLMDIDLADLYEEDSLTQDNTDEPNTETENTPENGDTVINPPTTPDTSNDNSPNDSGDNPTE